MRHLSRVLCTLAIGTALTHPSLAAPAGATQAGDYASETEYKAGYSLAAINAAAAFARGYTGLGVTIAVLDSGIDRGNYDLLGRVLPGYNFLTNTAGVTNDTAGHGTFVSGIIAASRNGYGVEGIAFNSTILPEQIINASGAIGVNDATLAQAINYGVSNGATIINNSWNSTTTITQVNAAIVTVFSPYSVPAWQQAVAKGALVVFAAGNEGKAQVGYLAGLPALYPSLKAGWIAAVATDQTGAIASYSNRCGVAAAWCMAAPGSNIVSTYKTGFGMGSGTSFAAPAISAAAADLQQEFPYLTAGQVGQILLKTANKTGIYADTSVYGQGMLDLEAATRPVGVVSVPTGSSVNGAATPVAFSGAALSGAFGSSFARDIGPVLVLDEFQRGYQVDGSALVHTASAHFDVAGVMDRFGNEDLAEVAPGVKASFAAADPSAAAGTARMRMQVSSQNGHVFETDVGVNAALAYGSFATGTVSGGALVVQDGVGNPYLSLADKGVSVRNTLPLANGATVSVGAFEGYSRSSSLTLRAGDPSYVPSHVAGAIVEAVQPLASGRARLSVNVGTVVEQGSFLGSTVSGAFGLAGDTPTMFAGIGGEVELAPGVKLFGAYNMAVSSLSASAGSLVTHYGTVRSDSFAVGVAASGLVRQDDSVGFVVSQPLRVTGGSADLSVPFARDFDGNVLSHPVNTSLAAAGRETDLQGFYAGSLTRDLKFDAGVVARMSPNNDSTAPADMVAVVKFKMKF